MTIIALLAAILLPRFWRAHDRAQYTACAQNLKTIATGLETYAAESQNSPDKYPNDLSGLIPKYIQILPSCPSAVGQGAGDVYSPSYQNTDDPPRFTIFCSGSYHTTVGMEPNEPWYRSGEGLGPK